MRRLFTAIAPEETAEAPALPLTLLVRPVPVIALVVLAVNDHLLKGSGALPGWATGKVSDFAGLVFFPLLLVTLYNLAVDGLNGLLRRPVGNASATTPQLMAACLATAAFFSAVQIHEPVAAFYADVTAALAFWSEAPTVAVTMDPTDVVAVPMVLLAFWLGQRAIARVPPGRLPWLRARLEHERTEDERRAAAVHLLRDVRVAAAEDRRPLVDGLADALAEDAPPAEIDALLARLRGEVAFGGA